MKNYRALLPRGLKDVMPGEAEELKAIEDKLLDSFGAWGYLPVKTPAFEFYEVLASQTGELIQKEMFKLFDSDGELLALKPEMTTPLARMACQKFSKNPLPLRFSYIAEVFRQEPARRGQQRQFTQGGVELIGEKGSLADAEVICTSLDALKDLGFKNFSVSVGQVDVIEGIIEKFNSPSTNQIREALAGKNLAKVREVVASISGPARAVKSLEAALECKDLASLKKLAQTDIPDKAKNGIGNLLQTLNLIKRYGFPERVTPDLTVLSDFEYYTGFVFEIYSEAMGFPIGSGGRYDNLLVKFGKNLPAAGFAFGLERLHIALSQKKIKFRKLNKKIVIFGQAAKAYSRLSDLRDKGYKVALLSNVNLREALAYANEYGFSKIVEYVKGVFYSYDEKGRRKGRWQP